MIIFKIFRARFPSDFGFYRWSVRYSTFLKNQEFSVYAQERFSTVSEHGFTRGLIPRKVLGEDDCFVMILIILVISRKFLNQNTPVQMSVVIKMGNQKPQKQFRKIVHLSSSKGYSRSCSGDIIYPGIRFSGRITIVDHSDGFHIDYIGFPNSPVDQFEHL